MDTDLCLRVVMRMCVVVLGWRGSFGASLLVACGCIYILIVHAYELDVSGNG